MPHSHQSHDSGTGATFGTSVMVLAAVELQLRRQWRL